MKDIWYPSPRYILRKNFLLWEIRNEKLKGKTLLEIGYGSGDLLCEFAEKEMNVWGYDFSEIAYINAKKRIELKKLKNVYLENDKNKISNKKFDYLVACEVLEHIEEDFRELKEWYSLLDCNGTLILTVPARMKKYNHNDQWAGHYRRYEKKKLIKMCKDVGFIVDCCYSFTFPANIFLDLLLNKSSKKKIEERGSYNKERASKESGVLRDKSIIFRLLSNKIVMFPFIIMQQLFKKYDLGSSYFVMARKF